MKRFFFAFFCAVIFIFSAPARSVDALFPGMNAAFRAALTSGNGWFYVIKKSEAPAALNASEAFRARVQKLTRNTPQTLLEMAQLVSAPRDTNRAGIYNAAQRIRALAGRNYFSHTRQREVPLFKSAYRIMSKNDSTKVDDPPRRAAIPLSETFYIVVDDINFGDSYYQVDISGTDAGIIFSLTNTRALSVLLFTIIKSENLTMLFYIEPLDEGVLIYSLLGMNAETFASSKVDMPSAAKKRFDVIKDWLIEGITRR